MAIKTNFTNKLSFDFAVTEPKGTRSGYFQDFSKIRHANISIRSEIASTSTQDYFVSGEAVKKIDISSANDSVNIDIITASTDVVYGLILSSEKQASILNLEHIASKAVVECFDRDKYREISSDHKSYRLYPLERIKNEKVCLLAGEDIDFGDELAFNADGLTLKKAVSGDFIIGVADESVLQYNPINVVITTLTIKA